MSVDAAGAGPFGDARVTAGRGGQPRVLLAHAASGARAEIYLLGATLTSYVTARGHELLFVSPRAAFDGRTAIRGGVPVCFPQFADQGALPKHGFARTQAWALLEAGDGSALLELRDSPATRALWPHAFRLRLRVSFDGDTLGATLEVENLDDAAAGGDAGSGGAAGATPFEFEALLHTYLSVGAGGLGGARVAGLAGREYRDKPSGGERRMQPAGEAFALEGEVDRIYEAAPPPGAAAAAAAAGVISPPGDVALLLAPGGACARVRVHRKAALHATGPRLGVEVVPSDVVVWNPGAARCAAIADLEPESFRSYVCIEPGVVTSKVALAPGRAFALQVMMICE
jgi:glucose-6-phosphate 1-epimerase